MRSNAIAIKFELTGLDGFELLGVLLWLVMLVGAQLIEGDVDVVDGASGQLLGSQIEALSRRASNKLLVNSTSFN